MTTAGGPGSENMRPKPARGGANTFTHGENAPIFLSHRSLLRLFGGYSGIIYLLTLSLTQPPPNLPSLRWYNRASTWDSNLSLRRYVRQHIPRTLFTPRKAKWTRIQVVRTRKTLNFPVSRRPLQNQSMNSPRCKKTLCWPTHSTTLVY